ncbi:hypothetical protein RFI_21730 [Reticulomyxa filosa]|uniref:Kelch motif family protein n=1 Tax=Reticulomyxa filosa TaxID=46433 RepID=X6MNQ6_RETFI|nr:hypothetical protein RFI_21730 [Reticulomyxa filosa]|eukprot:ETO15633.1 hypothetical protein RFI_21730 [Reticulomyxa filosa]
MKKQAKQNQHRMISTSFQTLKDLPTPLSYPQYVIHKHEILICGSRNQRKCYSYHTIKNQYKFICKYPSNVTLNKHCVVKLVDNNNKESNQITLLSFGGRYKHTLVMKYASVWSNDDNSNNEDEMNKSNKLKKSNNYNEWVPFTDNHNNPIIIGRDNDNYHEVRAVIGGSNNHLLFITYYPYNISVFDLNIFQFIKHDELPTMNSILCHCLVSKSENGQGQEMMKTNEKNKQNDQMLLFCSETGLSIEYDEYNNTFQFHQLPVIEIKSLHSYACVCINDIILFFGGYVTSFLGSNTGYNLVSKSVRKYSIQENKWTIFKTILPSPLSDCAAILNEDSTHIHIIGGYNDKNKTVSAHIKTKVRVWDGSLLPKKEIKLITEYWIRTLKIKLGWIDDFNQIIFQYSKF